MGVQYDRDQKHRSAHEDMQKAIKHPTLSDVARMAGVGTTTVSRVINGGARVDSATLARVRSVIEALGYVPNNAARVLTGGRTKIIGFVAPGIVDPFFASCAEVLESVARSHDSLLIVTTTQNDVQKEIDSVDGLLRHRVEGLIIAPASPNTDQLLALLKSTAIPIVALDRPIAGSTIPSVVADNCRGARLATNHLIEHGYERIVCLTGEDRLYTIRERIRGYRMAMKAAGLVPSTMTSITDRATAAAAVDRLFASKDRPQALFTLKNKTTIDIYDTLQERNISIPDAVALVGYDDFDLAATLRPSVTVVQQPIEDLGRAAAELLFERLKRLHNLHQSLIEERPHKLQLKTRLVRRNSCGCSERADCGSRAPLHRV